MEDTDGLEGGAEPTFQLLDASDYWEVRDRSECYISNLTQRKSRILWLLDASDYREVRDSFTNSV